ncbi:hypothetical protein [Atlantibacter sp. RC6]|uniref:hypothetical protein n=1 Tax=Atlantibacter sp. RC6 TaxID=2587036 RepID=UPI001605DB2E|nr:hypothetical protein [Atlantibacter sp. RC6]MBB3324186.1 hypothetical protein [Atlantibacter sp. RC6]
MEELSILEIHQLCIAMTNQIIQRLGWKDVSLHTLNNQQKELLNAGNLNSVLNWKWAMDRYRDSFIDSILDLTIRVNELDETEPVHAVILCKYDSCRRQFSLCMLENFIQHKRSALSGKTLKIALIYSTYFCEILGLDDIFIQDPTTEARPRYAAYSFAQVWHDHAKISADVTDVLHYLRARLGSQGLVV